MAFYYRETDPTHSVVNNWFMAASLSIKQSGVRLKAYIDFMPGKFFRIFSHLSDPSHCRYRLKVITAEVTNFHLVRVAFYYS